MGEGIGMDISNSGESKKTTEDSGRGKNGGKDKITIRERWVRKK